MLCPWHWKVIGQECVEVSRFSWLCVCGLCVFVCVWLWSRHKGNVKQYSDHVHIWWHSCAIYAEVPNRENYADGMRMRDERERHLSCYHGGPRPGPGLWNSAEIKIPLEFESTTRSVEFLSDVLWVVWYRISVDCGSNLAESHTYIWFCWNKNIIERMGGSKVKVDSPISIILQNCHALYQQGESAGYTETCHALCQQGESAGYTVTCHALPHL